MCIRGPKQLYLPLWVRYENHTYYDECDKIEWEIRYNLNSDVHPEIRSSLFLPSMTLLSRHRVCSVDGTPSNRNICS